jgi:hypothetical protein
MAGDPTTSHDEFNTVLEELYDWADTQVGGTGFFDAQKVCWVEKYFEPDSSTLPQTTRMI